MTPVGAYGDGGNLVVINATPYNWQRIAQTFTQMNAWDFPTVIYAGQKRSNLL